jgi:hypothetical protein
MPLRTLSSALVLLLLGASGIAGGREISPRSDAPRIVAIADVHGSLSGLTTILREAALIDGTGRWTGGRAHLVQMGDILDRGAEVRQVMDLLMRLEGEARRAGGRVDVLFGNHEAMNLIHDLRDVSPAAYAAFADRRSEARRRRAFDAHAAIARRAGRVVDRDAWMAARPPGFVEYVDAISPSGRYGRWLRSRPAILRLGDTIFMHAGLAPDTTASLDEVNRGVEREIRTWDAVVSTFERHQLATRSFTINEMLQVVQEEIARVVDASRSGGMLDEHVTREFATNLQHVASIDSWALVAAEGPLWYRGFATATGSGGVERLLERYQASRFVVGHTPQLRGGITARFDGRVILADTGMLTTYYTGGTPSAVEIADGRVTAIYPGARREQLPSPAAQETATR